MPRRAAPLVESDEAVAAPTTWAQYTAEWEVATAGAIAQRAKTRNPSGDTSEAAQPGATGAGELGADELVALAAGAGGAFNVGNAVGYGEVGCGQASEHGDDGRIRSGGCELNPLRAAQRSRRRAAVGGARGAVFLSAAVAAPRRR